MSAEGFDTMREACAALRDIKRRSDARAAMAQVVGSHQLREFKALEDAGDPAGSADLARAILVDLFDDAADAPLVQRLFRLLLNANGIANRCGVFQFVSEIPHESGGLAKDSVGESPAVEVAKARRVEGEDDLSVPDGRHDDLEAAVLAVRSADRADAEIVSNDGGFKHSDSSCVLQPGVNAESEAGDETASDEAPEVSA